MYINGIKMQDSDFLPQELKIGKRYNINWSKRKAGFRLEEIKGEMAIMFDPIKKSNFQTPSDTLRLLPNQAFKVASKRMKNES